jgi:sarcosine oxidase subunit gamma
MPDQAIMRVKPSAARLVLQGDAEVRRVAARVWGVSFSEESCRALTAGDRATLWLGPDEHLMWQASRDRQLPLDDLEQALKEHPHSLVDVSHRQTSLEISGANAAVILSGACPLDFDLREFPVHMCTRTVLSKAEIVLWRTAPEVFHLEVWRSFHSYVLQLLGEIARPYLAREPAP